MMPVAGDFILMQQNGLTVQRDQQMNIISGGKNFMVADANLYETVTTAD